MSHRLPGALLALVLCACGAGRVARPPEPPAFDPARRAGSAPATPSEATTAAPPAPAAAAPEPAPTASAPAPTQATPAPETPAKSEPPPKPEPPSKPEPTPLGWIAGQPLEAEELLLEWGDASSRELWLVIDKLVAARLALAEAERLGIRLAPEAVEQRYAAERGKLEKEIARGGKERPLEEFIEQRLGFEPHRYLERVRRATIRQMLAERAVRVASFSGESAALRLIVVKEPAEVEAVGAALAAGTDFAQVAREHSVDDSKEDGGLVPFLVPEERSPLARLAFQTPPGEVAGPLPVGEHQFWIRVEERRPPLEGDWAAIGERIERSLEEHPVGDAEFVHWKLTMERRYPIDLGPLWSLIGAAR
ncbi:MAG TPA: peptidylprolyl isomerase [Planctomycetota bacterium]